MSAFSHFRVTFTVFSLLVSLCLICACGTTESRKSIRNSPTGGNSSDAGASDSGSNGGVDAGQAQADAGNGTNGCKPKRLLFLGDSIPACTGVGGKQAAQCGPKKVHGYLKANYTSDISYENISEPGAITADVANSQINRATPGSESILAIIYAGGNDLQPYIFASDSRANDAFDRLKPEIESYWRTVIAYFNDKSKFPGEVQIIMNKQFNPFDDCTASPFNVSARKSELLRQFNQVLADLADQAPNVHIVDHHTPFLGHGHHYRASNCPHYQAGNEYWMVGGLDIVHPNGFGHESIANVLGAKIDEIYENCN